MSESGSQLAIPAKRVNDFVPALSVVIATGNVVQVPLTAQDNLLLSQVRVAHLRKLMDTQISALEKRKQALKPMKFKALVESFDRIEEMSRYAYAAALDESEGGERSGAAAAQMAKAMAEGFAAAGHKAVAEAKEERRAKMMGLGAGIKKAEPVETKKGEAEDNWE